MVIVQKYKTCVFCGSNNLKISKNQNFVHNFYTKAIKNDLELKDSFFKKMRVYRCDNCYIIQNNPWFSREVSFKIFNQIYGQHNRNWSNVISFFNKGIKPNHGNLFNILNQNLKIKYYCEFNAPFMGLMLDFFSREYKSDSNFYKNIFNYSLKYLASRQIVDFKKLKRIEKEILAKNYLKSLKKLKKKNKLKKIVKKDIIIDNSYLGWLYNDNYKSVNSRSLASELLEIKFEDFSMFKKQKKYDLFGIFHTLDHTDKPKKILDFALENSKYVLIYCHSNKNLEKQHLFSFTNDLRLYLKKRNLFHEDLTHKIAKNYKSKEIYILCSKFYKINIKF